MDNVQILETAKAKKAKGMDLNSKETELYNNYLNIMQTYPNTYKNDAYGLLSELYDNLQNFDPEQTDKNNQTSIYFEIDSAINNAILFAKTTELKPEKANKIIKKSKFLNEVKAKLTKVNEADINEIENAFDFDLDGNDTPRKFIEHAELIEAKILKGIETDEPEKVANEKVKKTINDFIYNVKDKETFLNDLKETFTTEKGQKIRALIELLKEEDIIIKGEREFKAFYEEFKKTMKQNIGEYQGINDLKEHQWKKHQVYISKKLNSLILKHKTK